MASACGAAMVLSLIGALSLTTGCASTTGEGTVELRSMGREQGELRSAFEVAAFSIGPAATAIYLSDVPIGALVDGSATTAQVVHIELLWKPRAGFTPIEDEATNASIRYVVFVDGEVGIYGGAGMVKFRGKLNRGRVRFTIDGGSMSLLDSTPGFLDRLSPASFSADVLAIGSDEQALRLRQAVSQRITNAFGETRIVLGDEKTNQATDDPTALQPTIDPILTLMYAWRWPSLRR